MVEKSNKPFRLHCNSCGRSNEHLAIYSYRNKETDEDIIDNNGRVIASVNGYNDWELLECQG